jgi:hypothetical protein
MSKMLVLELPDDADIAQALHDIRVTARVHVATNEDAAKVLSVFEPSPSGPEETS